MHTHKALLTTLQAPVGYVAEMMTRSFWGRSLEGRSAVGRGLSLLCLSVLTVGVLAGCQKKLHIQPLLVLTDDGQTLDRQRGEGVVPDRMNAYIPDAPQPVGFKMIGDVSYGDGAAAGSRKVYHYYQGRAFVEDVQLMYNRQLPNFGWKAAGTQEDPWAGYDALVFTKPGETLYIRVRPEEFKLSLVIEIQPGSGS